ERTALALEVNRMVREGELSGPVAFTRDHLDAGGMAHPNIMTENMRDGSDAIADWPLLNAMLHCSSMADLVAIHSGGGGYAGYMTSAGVTVVADGSTQAQQRLALTIDNDTSLGVMREADALDRFIGSQVMAQTPRRPVSAVDKAEALFKQATTKPIEGPPPKSNVI